MGKFDKMRMKRIKSLLFLCVLTAVIFSVSTYAWFIGMQTVGVSSFDIEIAVADDLSLSIDGKTWASTIEISKDTYDDYVDTDGDRAYVYEGHTNSWAGEGLIPMSSIGKMDSESSRMILYEKASLTSTPGGYRLMASRVDNYSSGKDEQDGYVVFDLFVKNLSGAYYNEQLDLDGEEAIYLTIDSEVTVGLNGVKDTGIENSVRVAFTQIGRVSAEVNDQSVITGVTCETKTDGNGNVISTGICRDATIWEPNNTKHVENAINWYETSCLKRTGSNVRDAASYDGDCNKVVDGLAYSTYVVSKEIESSDNVNVYDGADYNGYTGSDSLLIDYPFFTDTHKILKGTNRPAFMTLAPNSITKVRIYVYIEGQDIDNYDFASIGREISVKFGFTKERYTEEDINYSGSHVNEGQGPEGADKTPPVITLVGNEEIEITIGDVEEYEDEGATAIDDVDDDITEKIEVDARVNVNFPGTYYVIYRVTDEAKNMAVKVRTVRVIEEEQGSEQE